MKAVFRVWKQGGELFAIFPEFAATIGGFTCMSADRNGHSVADYSHCIQSSRPAKPEEVERIWSFLSPLGYRREEVQFTARTHHSTHRLRRESVRWAS